LRNWVIANFFATEDRLGVAQVLITEVLNYKFPITNLRISLTQLSDYSILLASDQQVLEALDRPHVLGAFERAGVGTALLAHAALHLPH
jgi:hypothetical protein